MEAMDCLFFSKLACTLESCTVLGTRERAVGTMRRRPILLKNALFMSNALFLSVAGMKRLLSMLMYRSEVTVTVCPSSFSNMGTNHK